MRTIAHMSDLHFGRHSVAVAEALLGSIAELKPDLAVISGDLTQRARRGEFAEARRFIDRIPCPTIVVPGNHDVPLYNPLRRFLKPLGRFERYISAVRQPCFADDAIAVLGLNTARALTAKNGRVSFEQMAEIRRIFDHLPKHLFRILVTHHPLTSPEGGAAADPVGRSRAALHAVAQAGVHLLLSGHYHQALSGNAAGPVLEAGPLLVAHAGTAISTRTRKEANSYNCIRIAGKEVELVVMAWDEATGTFAPARSAAARAQRA